MLNRRTVVALFAIGLFVLGPVLAASVAEDWNDFLHYLKIGRLDLAKGYAKTLLESNPDPLELLELARENRPGYAILKRAHETSADAELAELSGQVLAIIEKGRFMRRSDPQIIVEEIRRLSTTERGWLIAVKRLQDAGEYAIPYVLDAMEQAMADEARQEELSAIIKALPEIGRPAIRPLAAALQTGDAEMKVEIIRALGKISYPQALPYLKYIMENSDAPELRQAAAESIGKIDPAAAQASAAELFFRLGERYYYHADALAPAADANFANIWFWDADAGQLTRAEVAKDYFHELMAMRCCEWSLKSDSGFGWSIGLWLAGFFKAEATGLEMPAYFGSGHADAMVYATTAGPEYEHLALARAIKDGNADVALGAVEALAVTAGEKSLLFAVGSVQPLLEALTFDDRAVRYSAAIAVASAGPRQGFAQSETVVRHLAEALLPGAQPAARNPQRWNEELAQSYALRSAEVMLKLAQARNPAMDLSLAQSALVNATRGERHEIQVLAGQILAHLESPQAQRAIAAMALDITNEMEVRIAAFESLTKSAKLHANLLTEQTVDDIYTLVSSNETVPELRSAAAIAFGALNLPSRKVKDLILDQARS
jgi:hypothetical protein